MIEDVFMDRRNWTSGLILLRTRVEMILLDQDRLLRSAKELYSELRWVDRMLQAIPNEPSQRIYMEMVERNIGHLYGAVNAAGIGRWRDVKV